MGTQPKWVQTPNTTSHCGFLTRSESGWGSLKVLMSTLVSVSISSAVLQNERVMIIIDVLFITFESIAIWSNRYIARLSSEVYLCLINNGFPLHLKVTFFPSGISPNLISILAEKYRRQDKLFEVTNTWPWQMGLIVYDIDTDTVWYGRGKNMIKFFKFLPFYYYECYE